MNPQQDETEAVCLWALDSSDSLYLIFLRDLSNPGSGIWLPRVAPRGNTLGIGVRGGEQRVTIMYSVNESVFLFFLKLKKSCVVGGRRGYSGCVCVCFRISKPHSCPFSLHVRFTRPVAAETQGRGSDSSRLLSVLSGQLSPGQGSSGDMQRDTVLSSSHGGEVPSPNSSLFMWAPGSWQALIPGFRLHFSVSPRRCPSILIDLSSLENELGTMN